MKIVVKAVFNSGFQDMLLTYAIIGSSFLGLYIYIVYMIDQNASLFREKDKQIAMKQRIIKARKRFAKYADVDIHYEVPNYKEYEKYRFNIQQTDLTITYDKEM